MDVLGLLSMKNVVICVTHYDLQFSENILIFECERYLWFLIGGIPILVFLLFNYYTSYSNCALMALIKAVELLI